MSSLPALPRILLLEDEALFVLGWESMLAGQAELISFPAPEALLAELDRSPHLLSQIRLAIVDQFYGPASRSTGLQFAPHLRALLPAGAPIFLSSTGIFPDPSALDAIDRVIDKVPVDYARLLAYS